MIIECPCKKKKFNVDINLIPAEGRNLQCGSCDRVWFYKKDPIPEPQQINEDIAIKRNDDSDNLNDGKFKDQIKKQNHQNILEIRQVIQSYGDVGKIYLGGIPMIADDMMTFIKSDIVVFGIGVLLFIVATLWFVFRKLIWIIVPISSCIFSVVIMTGLLGLLGWKVTVISSNFIALMLILTMAMNIHMSTRFLQLKKNNPNLKNSEIILMTTSKMFWPIIYTVLTTICAFLFSSFSTALKSKSA